MGTVFKDAKTGKIVGYSKKPKAKSPSQVFKRTQSGGIIISTPEDQTRKQMELQFQKELEAEKTRLATLTGLSEKQRQIERLRFQNLQSQRAQQLKDIQSQTRKITQEILREKQKGSKVRELPGGVIEIIPKTALKTGVSSRKEQIILEQFLPREQLNKLRVSTDVRETKGIINKAKKEFNNFKVDLNLINKTFKRNISEKDPKKRKRLLLSIPQNVLGRVKSIGQGFLKDASFEPNRITIDIIAKIRKNQRITKNDLKNIIGQSKRRKAKDQDIKNFRKVRNIALLGGALGLMGAALPAVVPLLTTTGVVATPFYVRGVIKDARNEGIISAGTQALVEIGLGGAIAKFIGKTVKPTKSSRIKVNKQINRIFKNKTVNKAVKKIVNKGFTRLERQRPLSSKSLRKMRRKEFLKELKLSPKETKQLARIRAKGIKRTRLEQAINKNIDDILSGKIKINARSSSKLRKLLRKRIIGKDSIKPLDVSAKGVFGRKLDTLLKTLKESPGFTKAAKKQYLKIKRKEVKRTSNERAIEQSIDDILSGRVKLTARTSSKLRKTLRKRIKWKEQQRLRVSSNTQKELSKPNLKLTKLKDGFKITNNKGKTIIEVRKNGAVQRGVSGVNPQNQKRLVQLTKLKAADKVETKTLQKVLVKSKAPQKLKTVSKSLNVKKKVLIQQKTIAKQLNLPILFRISDKELNLVRSLSTSVTKKLKAISKTSFLVREKAKRKSKVFVSVKTKPKLKTKVKSKAKTKTLTKTKLTQLVRVRVKQAVRVAQRMILRTRQKLTTKQKSILRTRITQFINRIPKVPLLKKSKLTKKEEEELLKFIKSQPLIYRPSLAAILFNITATKVPKSVTGLGIRPVIVRKVKRSVKTKKRKKVAKKRSNKVKRKTRKVRK